MSFVLMACLLVASTQAITIQRPCMNVVNYVEQLDTRYIADIMLKDYAGLEGVWLNITLDLKAQVLANKFGPALTLDNKNYVINRLDFNLLPGVQHLVRIMIKHNVLIPNIIKVLLNGRSICPGSIEVEQTQCPFCPPERECSPSQNDYEASPGQLSAATNDTLGLNRFKVPKVEIMDLNKICGTVTITKDKIHGGLTAEEGNYPWQMALIQTAGGLTQYKCSAGLISQKHVLTAAHCVTTRDPYSVKSKEDFLLYAGTTKINTKSENAQIFHLSSIQVHENYNSINFEDDIAMLGLHTYARITDYVRPLCLPTEHMSRGDMYDRRGAVAGWGYSENGLVNELRYAIMPIATTDQCIFSDRTFYSLYISPKVFCAGARNGTTVCQGDSGAPIVLEGTELGTEDRYYIRGLVSLSKLILGLKCSPEEFAIFTDVRSYLPWIRGESDVKKS